MWGDEGPRLRSDLARERTEHDATKKKLREAEARISVLEARLAGPRRTSSSEDLQRAFDPGSSYREG